MYKDLIGLMKAKLMDDRIEKSEILMFLDEKAATIWKRKQEFERIKSIDKKIKITTKVI